MLRHVDYAADDAAADATLMAPLFFADAADYFHAAMPRQR